MRENKHSNVCLKTLVNNNHDILDGETSPTQVLRMQSSTSSLTYFSLGFNQKNKHMNLRNNLAFITWSSATHRRGNWGISIRDVRGRNRRAYRLWKARFFAGYTDSSIRATYPSTGVHITVTRSSSSKRFRQNERLYSPNAQWRLVFNRHIYRCRVWILPTKCIPRACVRFGQSGWSFGFVRLGRRWGAKTDSNYLRVIRLCPYHRQARTWESWKPGIKLGRKRCRELKIS